LDVESLVKKAKKGSDEAFLELMNLHKNRLYRIAISYLTNDGDAIEAVQEVTFRAYRSIKKLKNPEYFSTWLIRIMLNYCHDESKKKKRTIPSQNLPEQVGTIYDSSTFEVEEALAKLEEPYRQVITLKYIHDLKIKEIADILESPEGTVKTWIYKGLGMLRKQFGEKGGFRHV
jgi:RNA polymerase sigma-70 factor (TIGR02954 family)